LLNPRGAAIYRHHSAPVKTAAINQMPIISRGRSLIAVDKLVIKSSQQHTADMQSH